ncbi:Uncharacterised protein [Mycobacteroides abscessus]|nr:Uncharacterised protein [Mycobacteroides abscessus]
MPSSDDPACTMSGRACGERGVVSAPCTEKWVPTCAGPWILAGSAQTPAALSASTASSSHESQSRNATSRNSAARSYRTACAGWSSRPKLRAISGPAVVTTFHPARPPETWSIDAKRRARL